MRMLRIASDHAGFDLKEKLKLYLDKIGVSYIDLGPSRFKKTDDYPIYASKLCHYLDDGLGILICGSAQGMSITANKFSGVRAFVPVNLQEVSLARKHENCNVMCLSGWYHKSWKKMVDDFLSTRPSKAARHLRRQNQIKEIENGATYITFLDGKK